MILLLLCFRSLLEILVTILCFFGLSRLLVRLIVIRLGFRIGFVLVRFLLLFLVLFLSFVYSGLLVLFLSRLVTLLRLIRRSIRLILQIFLLVLLLSSRLLMKSLVCCIFLLFLSDYRMNSQLFHDSMYSFRFIISMVEVINPRGHSSVSQNMIETLIILLYKFC